MIKASKVYGKEGQGKLYVASAICTRCPQHKDQSLVHVCKGLFFSTQGTYSLMVDTSVVSAASG